MKQFQMNGISVYKTFVILNGVTGISNVSSYEETYKDAKGVKRKKKHTYFNLEFGNATTRFERLREGKFQAHKDNPYTLVIYADEPLQELREKIISKLNN